MSSGSVPQERTIDGRHLTVTSADKVFFPAAGPDREPINKGVVVDYYERIGELMVPGIVGRPLVVQRFPDGIEAFGFYQKNTPQHAPDWIERTEMATADGGTTTYPVIDGVSGLVWFANQGAVVFHTLLASAAAPLRPVEVIFDLDPSSSGDERADISVVQDAARDVRAVLDDLGLEPRVKSSGSRGLHLLVDVIDAAPDFALTATFARRVAELVAGHGPFTLEHRKASRGGRLFLDVLRNAPAAHAVAPWSLRALPGAPVAVPLDWDEALGSRFHPQRITIRNVFRRLAQKDDPWAGLPAPRRTIAQALRELDG